jgi:ABC-2 type transport system ATP-binding protein
MTSPTGPAVEFRTLTKTFDRNRAAPLVAVDALDLEVARGQVFGLLGPNGSGKTTAVNVLCGLLRPTSGTVVCEGLDVRSDVTGVRSVLGVVPQETALYNELTAQENLAFHARLYRVPAPDRRHRIAEVLELVGLTARRHDRAGTFSGGMQRRLALARALLTRPSVVVLDEPTLGVDVQSRAALWQRIRTIAEEGGTVLLTTNYMEEAQALADQLAIIDRGKLVTTGTPDALRSALGQTFIELRTTLSETDRAKVEELPGITAASWQQGQVTMAAYGKPATLNGVTAWFARQGCDTQVLGVRRPDLNDVFLSLTGTALRDGGAS